MPYRPRANRYARKNYSSARPQYGSSLSFRQPRSRAPAPQRRGGYRRYYHQQPSNYAYVEEPDSEIDPSEEEEENRRYEEKLTAMKEKPMLMKMKLTIMKMKVIIMKTKLTGMKTKPMLTKIKLMLTKMKLIIMKTILLVMNYQSYSQVEVTLMKMRLNLPMLTQMVTNTQLTMKN